MLSPVDVATLRGLSAEPTLPAQAAIILDQLETADVGDLQELLGALIELLDGPVLSSPGPRAVSIDAQLVVRDLTGDLHFIDVEARDEFGHFWTQRAVRAQASARPRRQWSVPQGLVPVAAVAAALTVAMAWIG